MLHGLLAVRRCQRRHKVSQLVTRRGTVSTPTRRVAQLQMQLLSC
jgi:hypothetical protein